MNVFDEVKARISISDALAFYGIEMSRANKALCPFHNEKTPSFTIYPKSNSWHCFGCGVGGSSIDFVMNYFGIEPIEAAKKLDSDFNLGIFKEGASQEETNRQSEQHAQHQAFKELSLAFESYMNKSFTILCDYLNLLHEWKATYAPQTENEAYNPLFITACHELDYIEHLTDSLLFADFNEQLNFYSTHRTEMIEIARKVERHTKSTDTNETA
jgi:hypothetical protein